MLYFRRMMNALKKLEKKGKEDLVHDLCLGKKEQLGGTFYLPI